MEAYLTTYADILPPAHLFNASGRAFPDVVTVGHNLEVVDGGKFVPTGMCAHAVCVCLSASLTPHCCCCQMAQALVRQSLQASCLC